MKRLTLILFAALAALSCSACSSSGNSSYPGAPSSASSAAAPAAAPPAASYEAVYEEAAEPYTAGGDSYNGIGERRYSDGASYKYNEGPATPLPLLTPGNSIEAKLVYEVNLQLQTTSFMAGSRLLLNTAAEMGGYSLSTYIEGRDLFDEYGLRYARYDLRIPSAKLSEFLVKMEESYNLLRLEQNSQDITARYGQTDTRLGDLKEQELRLKEMLEAETDTDKLRDLEYQLSSVQSEIASLAASASSMEQAVLYSVVSVHLYEVMEPIVFEPEPEPTWSERLGDTAQRSLDGFVGFCQGLLLFLIAALPVLVVLAALGAAVWAVRRLLKKKGALMTTAKDFEVPPEE